MSATCSLCFLHGFLGDSSEWHDVMRTCEQHARCVSLPLPVAANWNAAVDSLTAQIPADTVLIGYSMGARVALGCVCAAPTRYRAVCLISGNPGLSSTADRIARAEHDEVLAQRLLTEPIAKFLNEWYSLPLFAGAPPSVRQTWIHERLGLDRHYHADLLRCLSVARQPDLGPCLAKLRLPCLMLAGQLDSKYLQIARQSKLRNSRIQVAEVPQAGHALHRERPDEVAKCLLQFIAQATKLPTNEGCNHVEF